MRVGDDGIVRIGITDYAQDALGDVVFVTLPEAGTAGRAPATPAARSSRPRASATSTPRSPARSTARNEALDATPELVNSDPYGEGWMFEVRLDGDAPELLDAAAYAERLG